MYLENTLLCLGGSSSQWPAARGDALLYLLSPGAGRQQKDRGMAGAGARQPALILHRGLDCTSRTGGISPPDCSRQTALSIPSLSITISHQFVNVTCLPEGVFTLTVHPVYAL